MATTFHNLLVLNKRRFWEGNCGSGPLAWNRRFHKHASFPNWCWKSYRSVSFITNSKSTNTFLMDYRQQLRLEMEIFVATCVQSMVEILLGLWQQIQDEKPDSNVTNADDEIQIRIALRIALFLAYKMHCSHLSCKRNDECANSRYSSLQGYSGRNFEKLHPQIECRK